MNDGDLKNEKKNPDTCKTGVQKGGDNGRTKTGDEEKEDRNIPNKPGEVT